MLYVDYLQAKVKYEDALIAVSEILDEKTVIFQRTQPKSPIMDSERVDGGTPLNKSEEYVVEMEQKRIEERLETAKSIMMDRKVLLDHKLADLKQSKNIYDRIYRHKWLDGMRVGEIGMIMHYSEAQVYRLIKIIEKNINMIENERK
jgi:hypothetical protein